MYNNRISREMEKSNNIWKRPENVPYPSVWSKFDGKREMNGVIPKFWIQDIPEEQFPIIAKYMITHFLNDEPISAISKITSDKQSVEEMFLLWKEVLKEKVGLICYMENPDINGEPIIAGWNCTCITSKNNKSDYMVTGEPGARVLGAIDYVSNLNNYHEILGEEHLLSAMGLYVFSEFRGQALGGRLLEAREPLCRAIGIKGTVTAFTAIASQTLAEKTGFKVLTEVSYEDLEKVNPLFSFPGVEDTTKTMKYMYKMYY